MAKKTTTTEKLQQLVVLALSSDRDGERIAAVEAIGRILQSNNIDTYKFAGTISLNGEDLFKQGYQAGLKAANGIHSRSEPSWHEIACECVEHSEIFYGEKERGFVEHMVRATTHGGKLSEKQESWLRKIYARVSR